MSVSDELEKQLDRILSPLYRARVSPNTLREELLQLHTKLDRQPDDERKRRLTSKILYYRILVAEELRDRDAVIDLSTAFLTEFPDYREGFVNVLFPRIEALHAAARHDAEPAVVTLGIESPYLTIVDKLRLINHLARTHPEDVARIPNARNVVTDAWSDLVRPGHALSQTDPPSDIAAQIHVLLAEVAVQNESERRRLLGD